MNVDHILTVFNRHKVRYLVIGGIHFLIRHKPILTYDIDLWLDSEDQNVRRCEAALTDLDAAWGISDADWGPVRDKPPGWLTRQPMYCLTSPYGAIDVFLSVAGLLSWSEARRRAIQCGTAAEVPYIGLSDEDMLTSQMALPPQERNPDRIQTLQAAIGARKTS